MVNSTCNNFLRYLKQKKPACGNQVLFYFSTYLKKYTLYKKSRAPFFKLYQALFTIRKQGYTIRSTSKTVYIKVLLRKLVKKGSQYSLNIFNCTLEYPNVPCKILELLQLKGGGRGNRSLKNISNNQTHQIFALFATVFILKKNKNN